MDPIQFNQIQFNQVIPFAGKVAPLVLWSFLGFLAALSVFLGAVLFYHYKNFSLEPVKSFFMLIIYAGVCVGLLIFSLTGISLYLNSL